MLTLGSFPDSPREDFHPDPYQLLYKETQAKELQGGERYIRGESSVASFGAETKDRCAVGCRVKLQGDRDISYALEASRWEGLNVIEPLHLCFDESNNRDFANPEGPRVLGDGSGTREPLILRLYKQCYTGAGDAAWPLPICR